MSYLPSLVIHRAKELGVEEAAKFFGVSNQLIRQWVAGSKPVSLSAVEKVFEPVDRPTETPNWEGKEVMLLLPWYKQTNPITAFALMRLLDKEKMGVSMKYGDAFIAHTRNSLIDSFFPTGRPWALMVDDDMILPCGDATWFKRHTRLNDIPDKFAGLHTINRLLSHDKTLVSALYFGRQSAGAGMYYEAMIDTPEGHRENRLAHEGPRDELKPVRWAATGCLLVHRKVIEDLRAGMPWLAPQAPGQPWNYFSNASDALFTEFERIKRDASEAHAEVLKGHLSVDQVERFLGGIVQRLEDAHRALRADNRLTAGEDETFGRRAAKVGHQTYVDMAVVCGHLGGTVYGPENTRANLRP